MQKGLTGQPTGWRGRPGRKAGAVSLGLRPTASARFSPCRRGCLALADEIQLLLKAPLDKRKRTGFLAGASGAGSGAGERHQNVRQHQSRWCPLIKPRPCWAHVWADPFKSLDGSHHPSKVTLC